MNIEQLTRAMDDLDRRIRLALPFVADIFIDVTANRARVTGQATGYSLARNGKSNCVIIAIE